MFVLFTDCVEIKLCLKQINVINNEQCAMKHLSGTV